MEQQIKQGKAIEVALREDMELNLWHASKKIGPSWTTVLDNHVGPGRSSKVH